MELNLWLDRCWGRVVELEETNNKQMDKMYYSIKMRR